MAKDNGGIGRARLSQRVGKVASLIPMEQRNQVIAAMSIVDSFAALPVEIQQMIITAEATADAAIASGLSTGPASKKHSTNH